MNGLSDEPTDGDGYSFSELSTTPSDSIRPRKRWRLRQTPERRNAEFVGRVAADALSACSYHSIEFDLDPPKRGGERPETWRAVADATADRIAGTLLK